MILVNENVYHLSTDHYSCLFRINSLGLVEHLHFGAPVKTGDAESFACRPGLGWGASVLLEEKDTASSADVLALQWSGSGRGDYRESPVSWPARLRIFVSSVPRFWRELLPWTAICPRPMALPRPWS